MDALATVVDADVIKRRRFLALTGLTLTGVAHQWLFDPARVAASVLGKRVDHAVVDDLLRVVEARRRLDDAIGGGTLLPSVREDLRLVVSMLRNAAYTDEVGRRLYGVAAEFSRLAGWLACDAEQPALAQRYFAAGLRAAHLSGDRAIGANVLGFMSIQAERAANPLDAILLAESALQAESALSPAVAASLNARLATSLASTGDATRSRLVHERSFDLLAQSVREEEPAWIYWFDTAEAEGIAGKSMLALGNFTEAELHLRRAASLVDPSHARTRSGWLCKLAVARVGSGRIDQACATANEAATLTRRVDSAHVRSRLMDFRRAAEPYARSAAVRDFDSTYRGLIEGRSA